MGRLFRFDACMYVSLGADDYSLHTINISSAVLKFAYKLCWHNDTLACGDSVRLRSCALSGVSNRLALVAQIYGRLTNCSSGVWDGAGCRFAKKC
jgi:hypothetical protein